MKHSTEARGKDEGGLSGLPLILLLSLLVLAAAWSSQECAAHIGKLPFWNVSALWAER